MSQSLLSGMSRLGLQLVPSLADTHDAPSVVPIPPVEALQATASAPTRRGVPECADMACSQPSVEFLDVEPGVEYRATFHVKNKLARSQRVRVAPLALAASEGAGGGAGAGAAALARLSPGAVPFTVRFSPPLGGVAPGMTVPVEVAFRMPGTVPGALTPLARAAAAERRAALEGERARLVEARAGGAALAAVDAALGAVDAEAARRAEEAARAAEDAGAAPAYRAEVVVHSECGGELRVPLFARGPRATFTLGGLPLGAPLSFGPVVAGTVATRTLRLANDSRARGAVVSLRMLSEEEGAASSGGGASRTPRPHARPPSFRVRPTRAVLGPAGDGDRHHEAIAHHAHRPHAVEVKVTVDARALPVGPHTALLRLDYGPSSGAEGRAVVVTVDVVVPFIAVLVPEAGGGARELNTAGGGARGGGGGGGGAGKLLPPSALAPPLHFGALLPGEVATVSAVLANRSPAPVAFHVACGRAGAALLREAGGGEGGGGGGGGGGGAPAPAAARAAAAIGKSAPPRGLFGDLVVGLGGFLSGEGQEEEDLPLDPVGAAAASLDFSVTPSTGVIPANGTFPVTLTYTAVDRRPPPSFRGGAGAGGGGASPRGGFSARVGAPRAGSPTGSDEGSIFAEELGVVGGAAAPAPLLRSSGAAAARASSLALGGASVLLEEGGGEGGGGGGGGGGARARLHPRAPLPLPRDGSAAGGAASHAEPPASPRAARAATPAANLRTTPAPLLAGALVPPPPPAEPVASLLAFVVPSLGQRVRVFFSVFPAAFFFDFSPTQPPPPPPPHTHTHLCTRKQRPYYRYCRYRCASPRSFCAPRLRFPMGFSTLAWLFFRAHAWTR
jgi:hypothetical protein